MKDKEIPPYFSSKVKTGVSVSMPQGYFVTVIPKINMKYLIVNNIIFPSDGHDVTLEIVNNTNSKIKFNKGDIVGHLIFGIRVAPRIDKR